MAIAISRVALGRPRLLAGLLCGLAAMLLRPGRLTGAERGILAWDIGVTVFLALTAALFLSEHTARMPADAARQQEGEWTIFALTVAGTIASLAAIIGEFSHTGDLPKAQRGLHVVLVGYTLFASWLMTHTTFALRYAHEFYTVSPRQGKPDRGEFDGGLEFPGEKRPDYLDFFYFALVLGMTFQVSDVQITARKFRRLATVHGLLGFLFNAVILALGVNIAAGLL